MMRIRPLQNSSRSCGNAVVSVLFISLAIAGCGLSLTTKVNPEGKTKPDTNLVKPTAQDDWAILANYVANGIITTPQELSEYVRNLVGNGDMTVADAAKLDSQFPNAPKDTRTLDRTADSAKLKAIQ